MSNEQQTSKELASYIARQLFKLPDTGNDRTQRLQFKGGRWPDNETDLGGICESALVTFLEKAISECRATDEPETVRPEDLAAALAHRACCGVEHDPAQGKLHGYCVVCGVPWPCDTAKHFLRPPPTEPAK